MGLQACPKCRALFDSRERNCPECGTSTAPRIARERGGWFDRLHSRGLSAPLLLILLNSALYVALVAVHGPAPQPEGIHGLGAVTGDAVRDFGGLTWDGVMIDGEWWRLLCPIFLHFGLVHIAFNCFVIHFAGRIAQSGFGPATFVVLYLAAGLGASVTSLLWHGEGLWVGGGASGSGFGILGMAAAYGFRTKDDGIKQFMIRWALIGLLFGLSGNVDNAAHIGGLATGAFLGWFAPTATRTRLSVLRVRLWDFLAMIGLALVAAAFLFALM